MKAFLCAVSLTALLVSPAIAHPHNDDAPKAEEPKKSWPYFGKKDDEKSVEAKVYSWDGKEMKEAAREFEDALSDTEVFSEMADLFASFASNIEVRKGDDDSTALYFDGEELVGMRRDKARDSEDRLSISGLGRNMTVERETVVEDGKSRTRIVIEMDGGDDVEIDLPSIDKD